MAKIFIKLDDPKAIMPTKGTPNSVGLDLTVISLKDGSNDMHYKDDIMLYDTGIKVRPQEGYYVEIYERSSFHKSGFSLANKVGIIDPDYRGRLYIALRRNSSPAKFNKFMIRNLLDTEFCKGFQLVLRKYEDPICEKVEELDETIRGEGGFGSTS